MVFMDTEKIVTRSGVSLLVEKRRLEEHLEVLLRAEGKPGFILHWGLRQPRKTEWQLPSRSLWPEGTTAFGSNAARSPFASQNGDSCIRLRLSPAEYSSIEFALFYPQQSRWDNNGGKNYQIRLAGAGPAQTPDERYFSGMAEEIIQAEMGDHSWTLMHRFKLCHDLLDQTGGDIEGLALLFAWLRFSAIRQLTWQRNYNTQPKELSHTEDRLTRKLGALYSEQPASRPLVRLLLTTVGRGGEGQKVRDEILNIMHRHHLKEVSGHFLEEWHQKLHNNTTPDDIVICQSYLEFLRSDGNRDRFYEALREGGVTKARLESFERPIKSDPTLHPHLKMGLIHDFENFLRILKSVHAGTDLETAIATSKHQLDGDTQNILSFLWQHHNDSHASLVHLVEQITEARRRLAEPLSKRQDARDLLYLDLALEQLLRTAVEKNIHLDLSGDQLVELFACVLENLTMDRDRDELTVCLPHWERLSALSRFDQSWSLHAKAVLDRVARALAGSIDSTYRLLQPKAELLGQAFKAEPWAVTLFSEEVVRGNSLGFVLSMLLRHLEPLLRKAARLGNWQIISRGQGRGIVEVVDKLRTVQGKTYARPTVIIADSVAGDEEIPPGITAVIAPDVTDIVSHVAVRARNANLLFASCYEPEALRHLKSLRGHQIVVEVNAAGDVVFQEVTAESPATASRVDPIRRTVLARAQFSSYAIGFLDFNENLVGKKAFNQRLLRDKLPTWIKQPKSVALPFGVFERVLSLEENKPIAQTCAVLIRQISSLGSGAGGTPAPAILSELRQGLLKLSAPADLLSNLRKVMGEAGLAWPADWAEAWMRIKQVWSSKWSERAYWSRQAAGIAHEDLCMAVLIQELIEAQYAFVIHTTNPINGDHNEVFAEIVLGLGETLVGNYPGRALSLIWDKRTGTQTLLSYPAKSIGLYGSGLIFRSDSNGEDLTDYAGAGLYDSLLLHPPRKVLLDYSQEPLIWDVEFRKTLFGSIARLALEVEKAFGSAQDIEGVFVNGQFYVVQSRPQVQAQQIHESLKTRRPAQ